VAVKRCKESFTIWGTAGSPRVVTAGQLVGDSDPLVKSHGYFFEDVEAYAGRWAAPVEAATAAPGERRSVAAPKPTSGDPFDPSEHSVKEVLAHLDTADPAETARVLAAETAGQARKGVLARPDQGTAVQ
jgi:hypothetical protein